MRARITVGCPVWDLHYLYSRQQLSKSGVRFKPEELTGDNDKKGKEPSEIRGRLIRAILERLIPIEGIENKEFLVRDIELVVYNLFMYGYNRAVYSWFLEEHYTPDEYAATQFRALFEPSIARNDGHFEQEYSPVLQPVKAVASNV